MCESPIIIYNSSLGKTLVVPCGVCDACRISKTNENVIYLHDYILSFKNCLFVTLTYDNRNCPFVVPGDFRIFRGLQFPYDIVDCVQDFKWNHDEQNTPLSNHPQKDAVGVLYYRDIQLFIKRLRKKLDSLYGKGFFGFKYVVTGEYGSLSKRPHYHFAFLSDSEFGKVFEDAIISSWQMCDWSKLNRNECFKSGQAGIASYLSSYVNSCTCNNGVIAEKPFKAFVRRSKDINYSLNPKISETFKTLFQYFGANGSVYVKGKRAFENSIESKFDNLPSGILSTRILLSYVYPPREARQVSFRDYRLLCFNAWNRFFRISKSLVTSSDYLFILAFRRYCDLMDLKPDKVYVLMQYIFISYRLWNFYQSELLRLEMELFPQMSKEDYCRLKNNTYLDDPVKRIDIFYRFTHNMDFVKSLSYSEQPSMVYSSINYQKSKYGMKLLPKHFNDYFKFL